MHGLAFLSKALSFRSRFSFITKGFVGVRLTFLVKGAPIRLGVCV